MSERKKRTDISNNLYIRVFLSFCLSGILFLFLIMVATFFSSKFLEVENNWKIFKIVAMFISFLFFIGLMYISEPKEKDMPKLVEKTPVQKTT